MVEGARGEHHNPVSRLIGIGQNFTSGHAQNFKSILPQKCIAHSIRFLPVIVNRAINLDDQIRLTTKEIHDIRPDRVLATKLRADLPSTKALPEQNLGQAHLAAQFPRDDNLGAEHLPRSPSTAFGGPPPRAGEDHWCHPLWTIHASQAPFARSRTRPI